MLEIMLLVFGVFVLLVSILLIRSVFLIQQAEAMVIERFGRYHGTLYPGIHLVIPFIDIPRSSTWSFFKETEGKRYYRYMKTFSRIDLRETVYDFPKTECDY